MCLPTRASLSFTQSLLCPAVKNTHGKIWARRRERGTALPRRLWLEQGLQRGTSRPQAPRLRGHTRSREEVGLPRPLFPLAEAPPVCLSSLLFVRRNRTRSRRGELPSFSRGHVNQPWGRGIWALPARRGQERLLRAATGAGWDVCSS